MTVLSDPPIPMPLTMIKNKLAEVHRAFGGMMTSASSDSPSFIAYEKLQETLADLSEYINAHPTPDPERGDGPSIPSEAERAKRWRSLTDHLPALPPNTETSWLWSDKDIEMLRAACFRRFGESLRTESLFCIAATGIRIYLSQLQTTPDRGNDNNRGKGYCDHGFGAFSCSLCFPPQDREGLIEKLEALKRADYGDIKIALENIEVDKAIAIVSQYEAGQQNGSASSCDEETLGASTAEIAGESPAAPSNHARGEIRGVINDAEAVKILSTGYIDDQFESQHNNIGCCIASMEAAWQALKPHLRKPEPVRGEIPVAKPDKGNWVDNEMVLAIAKHPDFLKMLYAFRDPNIEDNCVVPAQVAFFAVYALKPWLHKPVSLADCAMALQGNERIKLGSDLQVIAKAVLEAANVRYHD